LHKRLCKVILHKVTRLVNQSGEKSLARDQRKQRHFSIGTLFDSFAGTQLHDPVYGDV